MVDKLFETGRESGLPMQFRIFDKKVLLPLEQLLHAVTAETGDKMSEQEIHEKAMAGGCLTRRSCSTTPRWRAGSRAYAPSCRRTRPVQTRHVSGRSDSRR